MRIPFPLLLATALGFSTLVQAQPNEAPPLNVPPLEVAVHPLPTEVEQWQRIRLKNVPAQLMAWWLDPAHNAAPAKEMKPSWASGRAPKEVSAMLSLPNGVRTVTGEDAQNLLWVLGTDAGAQQVAEKVALLDKPLQTMEVEARWVQISERDVKLLGINFAKSYGAVSLGLMDSIAQDELKKLSQQKRVQVVSDCKGMTISGSQANVTSTESRPAVIGIALKDGLGFKKLYDATDALKDKALATLIIGTSLGLTVTPTIDSEDNVTLQMGPFQGRILSQTNSNLRILLEDMDHLPPSIQMKDGQTMAIQGLTLNGRGPENAALPSPKEVKKATSANMLVLLTVRTVRRRTEN